MAQSSQGGAAVDLYQSGPSASGQFIRRWSLTLLGSGGNEWSISDSTASGAQSGGTAGKILDPLRISFQTRQTSSNSPGHLDVTIWNLARSLHPLKGLRELYNRIILRAGYQTGKFGRIFDGVITNWEQGRTQNLTEVYLKLQGTDGYGAWNESIISRSFASGTKPVDVVNAIIDGMVKQGATKDKIVSPPTTPLIRGAVQYGMSKDQFKQWGQDAYIQNGKITAYTPGKEFTVGEPIEMNAGTGLVGMARSIGPNGIDFDCLLNSDISQYQIIHLDNASVNPASGSQPVSGVAGATQSQGPGYGQLGFFIDTSTDGQYLAIVIEHRGDTRGNDWYTHVTCYPAGVSVVPGSDLPYYGFGSTDSQVDLTNKPPNLPSDPTGNYWKGVTTDTIVQKGGT